MLAVFSAATYLGSVIPEACPAFCRSFSLIVKSAGLPTRSEIVGIPPNPSLSRSPFRRIASFLPPTRIDSTRRATLRIRAKRQRPPVTSYTVFFRICIPFSLRFPLPSSPTAADSWSECIETPSLSGPNPSTGEFRALHQAQPTITLPPPATERSSSRRSTRRTANEHASQQPLQHT
ncbi:hypothetical protein CGRA01v4_06308 [Colletotrichum graminicola]|nr:hypothetical protein CGRA01v4_06308 [Colletotrichum graminicola]